MTRDELAILRGRFNFACGYCGVSETGVGAQLTVDHFRPATHGGPDEPDNWIYCCFACNVFKGAFWSETEESQLLNPLRDDLSMHIEARGALLFGLTARGAKHIERLRLNREQLIRQRLNAQATEQLHERLRLAEERLERATKRTESARRRQAR